MSTQQTFDLCGSLEATVFIAIARNWFYDHITPEIKTESTQKCIFDTQELDTNNSIRTIVKDEQIHDAQSHFLQAFRCKHDTASFTKHIKYAYNHSFFAATKHSNTLQPYDKIRMYSLLISSGFIYYTICGEQYLNGLQRIFYILCDINKEQQIQKDLLAALQSKIYWTDIERKLIRASVQFAARINMLIEDIQCHEILTSKLLINDMDEKQRDIQLNWKLQQYLDSDWVPRYYDGYFFGNINKHSCKYPQLSLKYLRNVMCADTAPYRIAIDDLVIHTYDLANAGVYIKKHDECIHHWFSEMDWIDFECVDKFRIYVQVVNNGRVYALEFNLYDTIKDVKHSIYLKENVAMAMMSVQYNNEWLKDHLTLYDYKISKDCRLKVTLLTFNPFLNFLS